MNSASYLHYLQPFPQVQRKILVIEDDPDMQVLLYETLQAKGFQVLLAGDGNIGLWMAEAQTPDLILSDVNLPGLDGLSVLQAVRQNPTTANIPFIFCTGQECFSHSRTRTHLAADALMVKPVDLNLLVKTVISHLPTACSEQV